MEYSQESPFPTPYSRPRSSKLDTTLSWRAQRRRQRGRHNSVQTARFASLHWLWTYSASMLAGMASDPSEGADHLPVRRRLYRPEPGRMTSVLLFLLDRAAARERAARDCSGDLEQPMNDNSAAGHRQFRVVSGE
jgi:hypothetical protein